MKAQNCFIDETIIYESFHWRVFSRLKCWSRSISHGDCSSGYTQEDDQHSKGTWIALQSLYICLVVCLRWCELIQNRNCSDSQTKRLRYAPRFPLKSNRKYIKLNLSLILTFPGSLTEIVEHPIGASTELLLSTTFGMISSIWSKKSCWDVNYYANSLFISHLTCCFNKLCENRLLIIFAFNKVAEKVCKIFSMSFSDV